GARAGPARGRAKGARPARRRLGSRGESQYRRRPRTKATPASTRVARRTATDAGPRASPVWRAMIAAPAAVARAVRCQARAVRSGWAPRGDARASSLTSGSHHEDGEDGGREQHTPGDDDGGGPDRGERLVAAHRPLRDGPAVEGERGAGHPQTEEQGGDTTLDGVVDPQVDEVDGHPRRDERERRAQPREEGALVREGEPVVRLLALGVDPCGPAVGVTHAGHATEAQTLRRYCPPTSKKASVTCWRLHTRAASMRTAKTLASDVAASLRRARAAVASSRCVSW